MTIQKSIRLRTRRARDKCKPSNMTRKRYVGDDVIITTKEVVTPVHNKVFRTMSEFREERSKKRLTK